MACQGLLTTIYVKVPYTGILDATTETFGTCRAEVREFLKQFVNWPKSTALFPIISGCPAVTFTAPYQFTQYQTACALTV